jgi:hypothetical protein
MAKSPSVCTPVGKELMSQLYCWVAAAGPWQILTVWYLPLKVQRPAAADQLLSS